MVETIKKPSHPILKAQVALVQCLQVTQGEKHKAEAHFLSKQIKNGSLKVIISNLTFRRKFLSKHKNTVDKTTTKGSKRTSTTNFTFSFFT